MVDLVARQFAEPGAGILTANGFADFRQMLLL